MSNPAINRFGNAGGPAPSAADLQGMYDQPAYTGVTADNYMTLDDVVQRTAAMLAVVVGAGAVAWVALPDSLFLPALFIALFGGLALGMFISFTMRANAATSLAYAAIEGVLLGAISRVFNEAYPGIVVQAVVGTAFVAGGMLAVYKIAAIRVTPRMWRIGVGAGFGVLGLMVVNAIAYLFTPGGLGLRSGGPIAIIFSLICIGVAAFYLVLDFDMIESGIRRGAPQKFAWYAAFGLTVTLVWLYIEILRLIGFARR